MTQKFPAIALSEVMGEWEATIAESEEKSLYLGAKRRFKFKGNFT
jgi:hypothetical protein